MNGEARTWAFVLGMAADLDENRLRDQRAAGGEMPLTHSQKGLSMCSGMG